jgi:chromosome segregation ATPase
MQLYNSKF